MKYRKDPRSPEQLVELLKQRGMVIADEAAAANFLTRVSFFRLKGYLLHFEWKHARASGLEDNSKHTLPAGMTFESILELYELDRRLRLLFFEAIERVEICLRTTLADTYAISCRDPHWIWDANHFKDGIIPAPVGPSLTFHQRLVRKIKRDTGIETPEYAEPREREVYVDHYLRKYTEPDMPPTWVLCECLSFGIWAQVYDKLAATQGQKSVSRVFQVPYAALSSWFHALSVVRNFCAHHARLWNRIFAIQPAVLPGADLHFFFPTRMYVQAFVAAYLVRRVHPSTTWHLRMRDVMLGYPSSERSELGAPFGWQRHEVWSEAPLPSMTPKLLPPNR